MKIRIVETGVVIEINESYIIVKDGYLFNNNTNREEAVAGDVIVHNGAGFVVADGCYTNHQIVPYSIFNKIDTMVLSANDAHTKPICHRFHVEEVAQV